MAKETLADAYVRIRADTSQAGADVKKNLTKSGTEAGKSAGDGFAKTLLKATAILGGAGAAISFFKDSISEGIEAQKVGAQTTAVLKSTGGAAGITATQVGNLANAISAKIGVDDEAIQSNENLLLTFTKVRNEVGKGNDVFNRATQLASDMSQALGVSGSAAALQLGKALNNPIKGITSLSRAGVSFTDKQKEAITQDVKRGDTLKAQKIILGELTKEFGGSAAAVATPGEKMSVAWKNLQETVGLAVLPTLGKLAEWATTMIPKILAVGTSIADWAKHSTEVHTAIAVLVVILTALKTGLIATIGYIADHQTAFKALAIGILAVVAAIVVWNAITKVIAVSQAILSAVMAASPIGLIILLIVGLVAAFAYLWTHSEAFRNFWKGLWKEIQAAAEAVGHWFSVSLPHFFSVAWDGIKGVISGFNKLLDKYVVGPFLTLVSIILNGAAKAFGWVPGLGGKLKTAAKNFDNFRDQVNNALSGIHDKSVSVKVSVTGNGANLVANGKVVGHLASGGTVRQSGRYLVGENGPEIADLPEGTAVYPHGTKPGPLPGKGGGGGNTFNIYSTDADPYELSREIDWLARAGG